MKFVTSAFTRKRLKIVFPFINVEYVKKSAMPTDGSIAVKTVRSWEIFRKAKNIGSRWLNRFR